MQWYSFEEQDLLIRLQVRAGSKGDSIEGIQSDRLKLKIKAAPREDRANQHLARFLASEFRLPVSRIVITHGRRSRLKTIRIIKPVLFPEWFELYSG